jgi:hypothetical protein
MPKPEDPSINDLYLCPICEARIRLHVPVTANPLCNNPAIHSSKTIEMIKSDIENDMGELK